MEEELVFNTVLAIGTFGLARSPSSNVGAALSVVFGEVELVAAKQILIRCGVEVDPASRRDSANRTSKEATVQDVVEGLVRSQNDDKHKYVTDAAGISRIPEFLSVLNGSHRLEALELQLQEVLSAVRSNTENIAALQQVRSAPNPQVSVPSASVPSTVPTESEKSTSVDATRDQAATQSTPAVDATAGRVSTVTQEAVCTASKGPNSTAPTASASPTSYSDALVRTVYNNDSGLKDLISTMRGGRGVSVPPLAGDKHTYSALLDGGITTITMDVPSVNQQSDGPFQEVRRERRSRDSSPTHNKDRPKDRRRWYQSSEAVKGTGKSGKICGPSRLTRSLFFSKLTGHPSSDDMKEYLESCGVTGAEVQRMSSPYALLTSFKVTVPDSMYEKTRSPDMWDEGILIRDFKERRRPYF